MPSSTSAPASLPAISADDGIAPNDTVAIMLPNSVRMGRKLSRHRAGRRHQRADQLRRDRTGDRLSAGGRRLQGGVHQRRARRSVRAAASMPRRSSRRLIVTDRGQCSADALRYAEAHQRSRRNRRRAIRRRCTRRRLSSTPPAPPAAPKACSSRCTACCGSRRPAGRRSPA